MLYGEDYVRTETKAVRKFSKDGAERHADRIAKRCGVKGACGVIEDSGQFWLLTLDLPASYQPSSQPGISGQEGVPNA